MVTEFHNDGKNFSGVVNGKAFSGNYKNGVAIIDSPSDLTAAEFAAIVALL